MVRVSWFSVSNSEWDHRQWKEGTVCHPLLPVKGSSGNGISTLNLDCGSCEYHHLSQLWLDQKAPLGKIFRIRWIWLIRFEVTNLSPPYMEWAEILPAFFFFFAAKIPTWDCAITTHQCAGFSLWCFKFLRPTKNKSSQPSGHQKNTTVNKHCLKLTQKNQLWSKRCLAHLDTFKNIIRLLKTARPRVHWPWKQFKSSPFTQTTRNDNQKMSTTRKTIGRLFQSELRTLEPLQSPPHQMAPPTPRAGSGPHQPGFCTTLVPWASLPRSPALFRSTRPRLG